MLIEAGKKTRRKVKEISDSVNDVSKLGTKVEEILTHIDRRSKDDLNVSGQMSQSLKTFERRMFTLENELEGVIKNPSQTQLRIENAYKMLVSRVENIENHDSRRTVETHPNSNIPNLENRLLVFRNEIADQMEELLGEVSAQSMNMIQSHTSYLGETIQRIQKSVADLQVTVAENTNITGSVNSRISDVEVQLLHSNNAPLTVSSDVTDGQRIPMNTAAVLNLNTSTSPPTHSTYSPSSQPFDTVIESVSQAIEFPQDDAEDEKLYMPTEQYHKYEDSVFEQLCQKKLRHRERFRSMMNE
jgi:hypothetical protein